MASTQQANAVQEPAAASRASRCDWCSKVLEAPAKCSSCRVTFYCNAECQRAHHPEHKRPCKAVRKAREERDLQETELRRASDTPAVVSFLPRRVFETSVGRFWGLHETRPYMRAKSAYAGELEGIDTWQARDAALSELMDCLRLNHNDNMGSRFLTPGLMLHLGRDQECYDFIKWWQTKGTAYSKDSHGISLHMNLKGEDAFEDTFKFLSKDKHAPLSFLAAMTLLKLKMLFSVEALENVEILRGKLPEELVRKAQDSLSLSNALWANSMAHIDQNGGLRKVKKTLEKQVLELVRATESNNKHFWRGLKDPSSLLDLPYPSYTSNGSVEDAQEAFRSLYPAFKDSEGAIERLLQVYLDKL